MKKELFMSAADRRRVLRRYGEMYALTVFIETGTSVGDTPWELKDDFDVLYTIELHDQTFREARKRFRFEPKIHPLQGDSTKILPEVLQQVEEPALIWLDGHYCGEGSAHGDLDTPVVQELETVFADTDRLPHVILVDDARIFDGQPEHDMYPHYADYPSCEWVEALADKHGYDYALLSDIMRLTPR